MVSRGSEASADCAAGHRFPAGGESLTEARRGNEHCPNLTLLPMILPSMILLLFSSAGGQSHIFTYAALFRKLYIQPNPLGQETAHSRLKLGSARRSNPTLHSRGFALFAGKISRSRTKISTFQPSVWTTSCEVKTPIRHEIQSKTKWLYLHP